MDSSTLPKSPPVGEQVTYAVAAPGVARITLARAAMRNAQGLQMTYELNAAFDYASRDDDIKVIILAASGDDFSSGHDLSFNDRPLESFDRATPWGQFNAPGSEGPYCREKEIYLDITERWRNIPKPVIAQVQGRVIAGGLMLVWCADLIIASDDARFLDNTPDMGINGVEWFMHPYEMNPRRAKEWLFLTEWLSASEAHRLGMVNRVVARATLEDETLAIAVRIAKKPLFTLKAIKESVNNAQDLAGRWQNMKFTFAFHHLLHSHFVQTEGLPIRIEHLPQNVQERIRSSIAARTPHR